MASLTSASTALQRIAPFIRSTSPWSLEALDGTKLPPASRKRQIERLANDNLSNGYSLFFHYVQPTLDLRRNALLESGITKKKFYCTVGQLYHDLPHSQKAFWNQEAARLRVCIKQKVITHEDCVRSVGSPDQWQVYLTHAEAVVAQYLCIPLPVNAASPPPTELQGDGEAVVCSKDAATGETISSTALSTSPNVDTLLLDTLPDKFTFEKRMLYGHFARYDLDEIRTTPTRKRQLEKRHQLADLFDQSGKVLFYYYAYPRLWKRMRPLDVDESIATFAQDIWHYGEGSMLEQWRMGEVKVKKLLGDGDLAGLDLLRLDSLDGGVLRLHEMAEDAVGGRLKGLERTM